MKYSQRSLTEPFKKKRSRQNTQISFNNPEFSFKQVKDYLL